MTGLSQEMVSYDLRAVQEQWRNIPQAELNELKTIQLTKIDNLEREYWEAWQDSKKPTKSTSTGKRGNVINLSARSTEKNGNPAYLQGVERCIAERAKILGLYAPTKNELSGANGGPIQTGLSQSTIDAIKYQILGIPDSSIVALPAAMDN